MPAAADCPNDVNATTTAASTTPTPCGVMEIIANNVATTYPQINASGTLTPNPTPTSAKQESSHRLATKEQPYALSAGLGLWPISPAASENVAAMRSTHGSMGGFLNRARTRFTIRSMGRSTRSTSPGRLRPSTSTPIMPPTRAITSKPSKNHNGDKPTVNAKIKKARSMMVANAPSMVICMSNAALVALPAGMPRRRASSTTSVVPAKLSEGAMVFMKNVPNTSGKVDRGAMRSCTALKQNEYARLCAKYLPNCVSTAATNGMADPCFMVSISSVSWSPRKNTTASTMMSTKPMRRFLILSFTLPPV